MRTSCIWCGTIPRDEGLCKATKSASSSLTPVCMAEDIKKLGGYSMLVGGLALISEAMTRSGFVDSIRVLPNVPANK
ncbi:MAG: hypothetical protein ACLRYE_08310 [Gemmiger formicilis]|uniref:hypothetical protein n=1 Tax=Gemmiger formicilis TaxID=745368 RepID=UPI0039A2AA8E